MVYNRWRRLACAETPAEFHRSPHWVVLRWPKLLLGSGGGTSGNVILDVVGILADVGALILEPSQDIVGAKTVPKRGQIC